MTRQESALNASIEHSKQLDRRLAKTLVALQECASIVDSFLNGQAAVTAEEMDSALLNARAALTVKE